MRDKTKITIEIDVNEHSVHVIVESVIRSLNGETGTKYSMMSPLNPGPEYEEYVEALFKAHQMIVLSETDNLRQSYGD